MEEPTETNISKWLGIGSQASANQGDVYTHTFTSSMPVPGTANAYPLPTVPQFVAASPEPLNHDTLAAMIRGIVREEMQSLRGEIAKDVLKEMSQQLRAQGAITEDRP